MEQHPNSIGAARLSAIARLDAGLPNLAAAAAERLAVPGEAERVMARQGDAPARIVAREVLKLRAAEDRELTVFCRPTDCLLRTRAYQAVRELRAGIEQRAEQPVAAADEDGPYAVEAATALLRVRQELAWRRGEDERALTAWLADEALGAFEIEADGARCRGRPEMAPDLDQSAG